MAITLRDLYTKFRAAGVYTVYRDQTVAPAVDTSAVVRLVVGFSKTGPFNVPVLINRGDYETAEALYGLIDNSLERKGSFFHRSLRICLEEGPVLALNLLKTYDEIIPDNPEEGYVAPDHDADLVKYVSLSVSPSETNGTPTDKLYSSYFNKERFWNADDRYLLATRANADSKYILNLVNLSQTPATIITRKSDIKGFDVTAEEWYGSADNIPAFVKKSDFISDYFIDVIVVDGNFGPDRYQSLATDPVFGDYFDNGGLIVSKLTEFLSLREVNTRNIFTGCIIPDFRDKKNVPYFLEDIINANTMRHGILCAIDRDELDRFEYGTNTVNVDMVGHKLADGTISSINFLGYKTKVLQDYQYTEKTSNSTITVDTTAGVTITPQVGKITVTIAQSNASYAAAYSNLELGDYVGGTRTSAGTAAGVPVAAPLLKITRILKTASSVVFDVTNGFKGNENSASGSLVDIDTTDDEMDIEYNPSRIYIDGTTTYMLADVKSDIYNDYKSGDLTNGDTVVVDGDLFYLKFTETVASDSLDAADDYRPLLRIDFYDDAALSTAVSAGGAPDFGETYDSLGYPITTATAFNIISAIGNLNKRVDIVTKIGDNVIDVSVNDTEISHTDFLVGLDEDGNTILTRIKTIQNVDTNNDSSADVKRITTYDNIKVLTSGDGDDQVERFKPFENYITSYNSQYLPGFSMKSYHIPDGTNATMKSILQVMTNTSMRDAIIDPDMINFRYYVDTFNNGLEPNSKSYIADMLAARQTCMGILNAPSAKEFTDSTNPRFTDVPTNANPLPIFNVEYVNTGGNLAENPEFLYTMPAENQGASWVSYFFPNIHVLYNNRRISIPPAALVSNAFVRKYSVGEPFKVVANKRGVLNSVNETLAGVEYRLTNEDRGNLEAKGINPIIQKKDGTIMIYGNQTGFQSFRSVLNNIHVRDMLITVQLDVENILSNYVFEFNDDALRLEVSSLLREYLQRLQNSYRVLNSFDVIFDRTNNTPEVVRENVGIIDLVIEPVDAANRYINRITLTKSGQPAVGGFVAI